MNAPDGDNPEPTPEQLAAYADGELDADPRLGPLRRRVERWLADRPEARAEVESQRRLAQLWQQTSPDEPAEATWDALLPALRARVLTPDGHPGGRRWRPFVWLAGALAAGAAAATLVAVLWRTPWGPEMVRQDPPPRQNPGPRAEPVEPFTVVTAAEVEIVSVRGPEPKILVARPPVDWPIALVARGDVELERAELDVRMGEGATPMLWPRGDWEEEES